jgi:hypothetical protein
MWTVENRLRYNRDRLRYPSDVTDDARRSLMRRVHEASYGRITGDAGSGEAGQSGPDSDLPHIAGMKPSGPRPPK